MLYLASGSPRRAELLKQIGVCFRPLSPPEIDETPQLHEQPQAYVIRMASEKADSGFAALDGTYQDSTHKDRAWVLGADTAVIHQGSILGKPVDSKDATRMLERLSGSTHEVLSAVVLQSQTQRQQALSRTEVTFRPLSAQEIADYVATGEPMDKAGAYGIQGFGALLVAQITGSYSGVVGLPLTETAGLLSVAGIPFWQHQVTIDEEPS